MVTNAPLAGQGGNFKETNMEICPECGGRLQRLKDWDGRNTWYWLECRSCGAQHPLDEDEAEYLAIWNSRIGRMRTC